MFTTLKDALKGSRALVVALAVCGDPLGAHAQEPVRIGIAAPLSGPSALLGGQLLAGARAGAMQAGATVTVADDSCTAEGGTGAARTFVAARVQVAVGFLCTEAIEAALPVLTAAGIPTITPGVRTDSLTDRRARTGWLVYRTAPPADAEHAALVSLLLPLWRDKLFAVVDDGTVYGRDIAESFRAAAEQDGLKPVFVDNYRPETDNQVALVGRLARAGADLVLVGGDRNDVAVMARDAAAAGDALTFAGGEALRSAPTDVPLAGGTLMVGLPEWAEIADPAVVATLAEAGVLAEGYVLPGYAASQVAVTAARAIAGGLPAPGAFASSFETAIGPIAFNGKGDLRDSPYRLMRYDGTTFRPMESQ